MNRVQLIVERDTSTKIPVDVYAYELPILQHIHGEDFVTHVSDSTDKADFDADEAYMSLIGKYGADVVKIVYRSADEVEDGEPSGTAKPKAAPKPAAKGRK